VRVVPSVEKPWTMSYYPEVRVSPPSLASFERVFDVCFRNLDGYFVETRSFELWPVLYELVLTQGRLV
jgi:hypothetical protein